MKTLSLDSLETQELKTVNGGRACVNYGGIDGESRNSTLAATQIAFGIYLNFGSDLPGSV